MVVAGTAVYICLFVFVFSVCSVCCVFVVFAVCCICLTTKHCYLSHLSRLSRLSRLWFVYLSIVLNCQFVVSIYLSVKTTNHKAISFYNKMGMRQVGETSWGNNTMNGLIYYKQSIRYILKTHIWNDNIRSNVNHDPQTPHLLHTPRT